MPRVINISDKLSNEKPKLVIGDVEYEVNDSVTTVAKFQEIAGDVTPEAMETAIETALGKEAVKKLNVKEMPLKNFKVLSIAILAAMLDITYDEAEARFQR